MKKQFHQSCISCAIVAAWFFKLVKLNPLPKMLQAATGLEYQRAKKVDSEHSDFKEHRNLRLGLSL